MSQSTKKESKIGALIITAMVFMASVLIAYNVAQYQKKTLAQILSGQANRTELELSQSTRNLVSELNGMAKRWVNDSATPENNWRADAKDFIVRIKGVSAIWWIEKDLSAQWGESIDYSHNNRMKELMDNPLFIQTLETTKKDFHPEISPVMESGSEKVLYITVPIGNNQLFDGFFIIEVKVQEFMDEILGDPFLTGFYTQATSDDALVYSNGPELSGKTQYQSFEMNLDTDDEGWEFKVYATEAASDILLQPLFYFIIGIGFIISFLFFVTLFSRLKAKNKSVELSRQISETEKVQFELEYLANHDALTHLPNRHYITHFIANKVKQGLNNNKRFTILFIDLDHFKDINDTLGHAVGDEMLKKLPVLFNKVFRHDDVIARMGGDEFVVYLPGELSVEQVTNLVLRFLKSLEYPIKIDEHQIRLTGSVGVAFFPQHGANVIELLSHADAALYRAKADGRNTFAVYDFAIEQKAKERVQLISRLHTAHDNNEFEMFFQPRYRLKDNQLVGAEALIRWRPNSNTLVKPEKFIDLLEETSLIIPITWKMFEKSCLQFNTLHEQGLKVSMSFNISAKQLEHPDFLTKLNEILVKTSFSPHKLELELTEQTLIQNVENSRVILKEIASMGISIAIDDFGTGYSSLSYLKNFPVNVLKIDQSFIRDITDDSGDLELVKTMIAMGKNLKITTVAEGVENELQLKLLQQERCDEVQGYFYQKPMPFNEFKKLFS